MSGSGKSTLINAINGIAINYNNCTYTGEVLVQGKDTKNLELYEISKSISSVFQNPKTNFFNVDTTMELLFYLENRGYCKEEIDRRLNDMLSLFPIQHLLDRNIFKLSGGEKQILSIAASYISGNDIIILDEPSSNLDLEHTEIIKEMLLCLKNKKITLIIAEHRLFYLMDIADRVVYLKNGEIKEEFKRNELLSLSDKKRKQLGLRCLLEEKIEIPNTLPQKGNFIIDSLDCHFKGQKKGLKMANKKFAKGSIIGIIGKNGIGKSTFANSLIGINKKAKIQHSFNNKKLTKRNCIRLSGLVMQDVNHQLFTDSVYEEAILGINNIDPKVVEKTLKGLDIWELRDLHPMSLSGGQKQRVAIASVLLSSKKIIYFDEPTSGMDYKNMSNISQMLKQISSKGIIIFIISHDTEFLNQTVDTIINLEDFYKLIYKNLYIISLKNN